MIFSGKKKSNRNFILCWIKQETSANIFHLEKVRFVVCDASLQHKHTDFKANQFVKNSSSLQANQRLQKIKLLQKSNNNFSGQGQKGERKGEIKVSKSITRKCHYFSAFSCNSAHQL